MLRIPPRRVFACRECTVKEFKAEGADSSSRWRFHRRILDSAELHLTSVDAESRYIGNGRPETIGHESEKKPKSGR